MLVENVEQEIWNDFKSLSENSLIDRLSYSEANSHFGVAYEDRNQLVHNGLSKKIENDEDFKINQFLLNSDFNNVNWIELSKLYPNWQPIELPKKFATYPIAKYRTKEELSKIENIILYDWGLRKTRLHSKIPNDNSAKEYLIFMRWDESPICPRCDNRRIYYFDKTDKFKCPKCGLKFSETVGTIFQNTKIKLLTWYEAMYLLTEIKTSKISTPQLAQAIGVTQKTSWGMAKKIQSSINDVFLSRLKSQLFVDTLLIK